MVSRAVVERCLQTQFFVVVGIMNAPCSLWESGNVEVTTQSGKDATGAIGEKGQSIATEVVFVHASDAGEKRMVLFELPCEPGNCECKRNVLDIQVGIALHVVGQQTIVGRICAEGSQLKGQLT